MTAVRALLSYASEERMDIPVLVSSRTIHGLNVPYGEIRYFEGSQIKALLDAPGKEKQSERRNRTLLILGYDAAMRVGELTGLKVGDLHLDAETPYIRILGKGEKYRSVPVMKKLCSTCTDISGNFMERLPIWQPTVLCDHTRLDAWIV